MAYEFRYILDYQYGTITAPVSVSDTTMSSAEFTDLSSGFTTTTYFPIVLLNPTTRVHEKAYIVGHTAASATVTVVRGKELTSAQAWPAGTQWISAPTIRDGQQRATNTSLPDDPHVGMRAMFWEQSESREYTRFQGWLGNIRANSVDMGRAQDGTTSHTAGYLPQIKMWTASGTTNASGILASTIPNGGFATRVVSCVLTRYGSTAGYVPTVESTSTKTVINILASNTGTGVVASTAIAVGVMAIGY